MSERLPIQSECDQDDPEQANQWVLVQMPFQGNIPFTVPENMRPGWSKRLHDAGYRHHPELQTIRYRPPHRGQQHTLNPSGVWVGTDDDDPEPVNLPDMDDYTVHEQQVVAEQLYRKGAIHRAELKPEVASVFDDTPPMNPADFTVSYVLGYLVHAPDVERRRVIAAEMAGKHRQGILRKYPGE